MASKCTAVLLLLLLDWGRTEELRSRGRDHVFSEEDKGSHQLQYAQTPGSLLRFLLQAMERPGRSPAFLFQPQRFGRNAWHREQLRPQTREFWSLAAPQRFGKK